MIHTRFSTVIKAMRLRYAIPFVLMLVAVYWAVIHPWMVNWGSTAKERQMALPGDELHPGPTGHSTQAITIYAPSDVVWQWLVQIGQDRAGFYTYTWLENLVGADIHNADEIHPAWQTLAVGDMWRVVPPDYLGNVGKDAGFRVLFSEPGHALVLEVMGAFVLVPVDENTTRLLVRGEAAPANVMMRMVVEPIVFTMARPMLHGLKARAEGRPDAPAALMVIARLGWAVAGIAVAALFLSRRRWFWLALPLAAALPALLMGKDIQAALAAFLAVGITMLGFLICGRSFWGAFLIVASVVLLTLLLAPEAYVTIGIAFTLLLLAALGAVVADRSRIARKAEHQLAEPAR